MSYPNFVTHVREQLKEHPKFGPRLDQVTQLPGSTNRHVISFKEGTKPATVIAAKKFVAGLLSSTGLKASRKAKNGEQTWGVLVKREGTAVHLQAFPNATLVQSSRAEVRRRFEKGRNRTFTGEGL
jgi:hypothetical protein